MKSYDSISTIFLLIVRQNIFLILKPSICALHSATKIEANKSAVRSRKMPEMRFIFKK